MRDSIRSIECIVRDYPKLTGKEVLELHKQDTKEYDEWLIKKNQEKHDFVNDINENGAYYRGKFGYSQFYYYNILKAEVHNNGEIIIDVEKIVIFDKAKDINDKDKRNLSIERVISTYERADTYGLSFEDKITKKEWDKVNAYLDATTELFW